MAEIAYKASLAIDRDKMAIRQSADLIAHLLRDFIPDHCFREAVYCLYEAFEKEGMELTSRAMRKEYEAWKSTQLEGLCILPPVPKVP